MYEKHALYLQKLGLPTHSAANGSIFTLIRFPLFIALAQGLRRVRTLWTALLDFLGDSCTLAIRI